MTYTHHCIVCGKGYKFCDSCRSVRGYTPWKTIADTSECYQLFLVIGICQKPDADESDFQNLERLAKMVDMKPSVADLVDKLLKQNK